MNHNVIELLYVDLQHFIKCWTKHSLFHWIASKFFKICTYWCCLFGI